MGTYNSYHLWAHHIYGEIHPLETSHLFGHTKYTPYIEIPSIGTYPLRLQPNYGDIPCIPLIGRHHQWGQTSYYNIPHMGHPTYGDRPHIGKDHLWRCTTYRYTPPMAIYHILGHTSWGHPIYRDTRNVGTSHLGGDTTYGILHLGTCHL